MNKLMLNNEWANMFESLPDEQAGKLIKGAFAYHMGDNVQMDDPILSAVFDMIKAVIDQNKEAYAKTCERNAENGRKGGRPKKQAEPNETQKTQSVFEEPSRFSENPDKANRIEKNRKEKNIIKKLSYGEYKKVNLTEQEYEKLVSEYGEDKTARAIEYLDVYIAEKGYKSKSHYLAIRRWVMNAVDEQQRKPVARANKFQNFPSRQDQQHKDMVAQIIAMNAGGS